MNDVVTVEDRIAGKIDSAVTKELAISSDAGGMTFANMAQAMEFAKLMAVSGVAVPKHLRGVPGACLGVVVQAIEWRMSPFAVANKSYSVNDRLAYEAQLVHAVVLQRAPIKGRIKVEYSGTGDSRVCRVWAELRDGGEVVDYVSPAFGRITPKNSPLWKTDPDQQHFYFSVRALARRHFPDVVLGVYAVDEIDGEPRVMRDVTDRTNRLAERLASAAKAPTGFDHGFVHAELEGQSSVAVDAVETESIIDIETDAAEAAPAEAAGDEGLASSPAVDADPVNWREIGAKAFQDGMSRRAVPPEARSDKASADEWLAGFDEAKGSAQ